MPHGETSNVAVSPLRDGLRGARRRAAALELLADARRRDRVEEEGQGDEHGEQRDTAPPPGAEAGVGRCGGHPSANGWRGHRTTTRWPFPQSSVMATWPGTSTERPDVAPWARHALTTRR